MRARSGYLDAGTTLLMPPMKSAGLRAREMAYDSPLGDRRKRIAGRPHAARHGTRGQARARLIVNASAAGVSLQLDGASRKYRSATTSTPNRHRDTCARRTDGRACTVTGALNLPSTSAEVRLDERASMAETFRPAPRASRRGVGRR